MTDFLSIHYSTPYIYFVDADECTDDTDDCDDNAVCTNTVGSYTCDCNVGYSGDGLNCTGKVSYFLVQEIKSFFGIALVK